MRTMREDLRDVVPVLIGCLLLAAPVGLVWAWLAPRISFTVTDEGVESPGFEGSEALIGADGSYLMAMLVAGVATGVLTWLFARRSGPWAVVALVVGGVLAALIAARVGLVPGTSEAIAALREGSTVRGEVELYLGRLQGETAQLRSPWAALAWPVGASATFLVLAMRRPEELEK